MNKLVLSTLALSFFSISSFAQSVIEVKDANSNLIITNSQNVSSSTTANNQTSNDFDIKNISVITQTLTVRRYDDLLNTIGAGDVAAASYCTGSNCFTPSTTITNFTLAPNATMILKADLQEASLIGESDIRYKIYNTNNSTDAITFTIKYNAPAGLKNNNLVISAVSDVYPNPSFGKTNLNIVTNVEIENVKATIINSLGAVVSVKSIDLNVGKNSISLDTENLSTGLYFAIISQGTQKITKKITISK